MSENNLQKLEPGVIKVALVTAFSAFIAILDGTIVSVAQPTFIETFNSTQDQVVWVMTAYTLALASVIPLTGWSAERIGTRNLYFIALTVFIVGSALCASSPSLGWLVAARVLQGLGGGMLMPLGTIIVTKAAGVERLARVMSFIGIPMLLGPILGPIIGGFILDHYSWHWIFLVNVPIGILALLYAYFVLPKEYQPHEEKFDFRGMLLLSPGLASLLYGLTSIADADNLFTKKIIIPILLGIILIGLFVLNTRATEHPLLELKVLKNKQYLVGIGIVILYMIGMFGVLVVLPLYLMLIRGETAMGTGLLLAPQGLGAMISMPIAGRLTDKFGAKFFVIPGLIIGAIGLALFYKLSLNTSYLYFGLALFITGIGSGMTMMPSMSTALKTLTPELVSKGSTLSSIIQQVSNSLGVALMTVIWTRSLGNKNSFYAMTSEKFKEKLAATPEPAKSVLTETQHHVLQNGADSVAKTCIVATVIVLVALIPASMLPKNSRPEQTTL